LGKQTHPQTDCPRPEGLLRDILKDNQLAELGSRVTNAVNYNNDAMLDGSIVSQLFDKPLSSSASRLSTFAACPYKHFARYVLDLKKRDEFKLEPLDLGDFYHRVLDGFIKRAVAEKLRFETVAPAALTKILDEEIEKLCRDDSFISKFKTHSPHNSFIVAAAAEYLRDCVLAISQMISAGAFRPAMSEVGFGQPKSAGSKIGEFTISLNDGRKLSLNGRIDRLDVATVNGRKVALVFDYKKRSESSFSWAEFFYGLDIQLAVYMLAVRNAAGKIVDDIAGAFYFPIEVSSKSKPLNEIAADRGGFAHKAKGIFNGEYASVLDAAAAKDSRFYNFYITTDGQPYGKYNYLGALRPADFEAFLNFSLQKITALAGQIISGRIIATPYRLSGKSPCSNCEYKPVCRFDWQINDYNPLSPTGKQQVLSQIANTDEPKER
jgi:ATP-dependent helicase/nuclease subunit B